MLPGLLDVYNDVSKNAQSVVVPACHQIAEPNMVVQADLAGRHSGVGQDLHGKEEGDVDTALMCFNLHTLGQVQHSTTTSTKLIMANLLDCPTTTQL